MRYTEYHNGIAVIKVKDGMQKLAEYEGKEKESTPKEKMLCALKDCCLNRTGCEECVFNIEEGCNLGSMDYNELKAAYKAMLEAIKTSDTR